MKVIEDQPIIKFVPKGWGFEKWIVNTDKYCGKLLFFVKGRRCSAHFHKMKDETFYVQSGKLKVYYTDDPAQCKQDLAAMGKLAVFSTFKSLVLNPGDNFYVPPGRIHAMVGMEDTQMFEFSTKHEDSDSYRIIKGD